jgi:hypothetical protein
VYWFNIVREGRRIQKSTKQGNLQAAREIQAAHVTALAKGEVGILERKKVPRFKVAMDVFLKWSQQDHEMASSTAERYWYSSFALLRFFGDKPLDEITPEEVERYIRPRGRRSTRQCEARARSVFRPSNGCGQPRSIAS